MIKVGITGGIGSGKSTVCRLFEKVGVPIFYADDEAKKFYEDNLSESLVLQQIKEDLQLSDDYFINDKIDKASLAKLVFTYDEALKKLTDVIHPLVAKNFKEWSGNQTTDYVMEEAAILFESGADKFVDKTIMVFAPLSVRAGRVKRRDGLSYDEIFKRMMNQMDETIKMGKADYVIRNYDDYNLEEQVNEMHNLILTENVRG